MGTPRMASVRTLVRLAKEGADGRDWYAEARSEVYAVAHATGVPPKELAEVLAVTSPRVSVRRNIRYALAFVLGGEVLPDMMRTVQAALFHWRDTGEIRGPKTEPFARALLGDGEAIVLDVWMARAFGVDQKLLPRRDVRNKAESRIWAAARQLGWSPAAVQAAVWCATVRRFGRTPPRFTMAGEI